MVIDGPAALPGLTAAALALAVLLVLLVLLALRLWRWLRRRPFAVIDGSNVMFWKTGQPALESVAEVLAALDTAGYDCGVIFDANVGYRLKGRFLHEARLRKALRLRGDRVMVVPKGTQADPYLLDFAQKMKAVIVSNDRFRDRIAGYPDLARPGRLVRGGWRNGGLWLDLPARRR